MTGCTSWRLFLKLQFRGLLELIAFPCMIIAVVYIPLTVVSMVDSTFGFWASIMAYFWLKEKISTTSLILIFIAYCGIALTCLGAETDDSEENSYLIGVSVSLVGAVAYGAIVVNIRSLQDVHFSVITIHLSSFCLVVLTLIELGMFAVERGESTSFQYSMEQWALILVVNSLYPVSMLT